MLPEQSNPKIDFSEASKKPNSINPEQGESSEMLPDDHLPKTQEDETDFQDSATNVVDDQIIIANLHGG